jgi:hypothetical protein
MAPQESTPSNPPAVIPETQAAMPAIDLQALAREILALLKKELRVENERQGRAR